MNLRSVSSDSDDMRLALGSSLMAFLMSMRWHLPFAMSLR